MTKRWCSESKGETYMTDKYFVSNFLFELSTLWCTSLGLGFWVVLWECVNYNTSLWSWIFLTALQSWTVAYSQTMLNPSVPILLKRCSNVFTYRASIHFFIFHSSSNITTWLARSPIVVHYLPLHLPLKLWLNLYINYGYYTHIDYNSKTHR